MGLIPQSILSNILQDLSRRCLVKSAKGPKGGFYIDKVTLNRRLSEVVEAVDGNGIFTGCGLTLSFCSESNLCPLHHEFKGIRNQIHEMLL